MHKIKLSPYSKIFYNEWYTTHLFFKRTFLALISFKWVDGIKNIGSRRL